MIKIKSRSKIFFKSLYLSSVILFCLCFGFFGAAKAYENTRRTGFGEYKKAVEYENGTLRIFDFEIELIKEK